MSAVVKFPVTAAQVDRLWSEYAALVRATIDNPELQADRAHVEAMLRAHRRFSHAFNATDTIA